MSRLRGRVALAEKSPDGGPEARRKSRGNMGNISRSPRATVHSALGSQKGRFVLAAPPRKRIGALIALSFRAHPLTKNQRGPLPGPRPQDARAIVGEPGASLIAGNGGLAERSVLHDEPGSPETVAVARPTTARSSSP
jgi:hypothetical protein